MAEKYDFSGWATKNDVLCTDGRIIRKDAFAHNDGKKVPLVWNHSHNDPTNVLGHAFLYNRDEGVYAYGVFNDTVKGQHAKRMVQNGDIDSLSIFANRLQQKGPNVLHGDIKEVSLVIGGANMEATIQDVMVHGEIHDDEGVIYTGEGLYLAHADEVIPEQDVTESDEGTESEDLEHADSEETVADVFNSLTDKQKNAVYTIIGMALSNDKNPESNEKVIHADSEESETIGDIIDTLNEKQKNVVYAIIGQALEDKKNDQDDEDQGGNEEMKQNAFDQNTEPQGTYLSHADEMSIIKYARDNRRSLKQTIMEFVQDNNDELAHADTGTLDGVVEELFPDYKDVRPGAPEFIQRDQSWVNYVINAVHKSPISRIRTRQADIRGVELRAKGYTKGHKKQLSGNITLVKRTTDPQTVYRRDALHRDDIIDITDFDVVNYQYGVMKQNMYEELATAFLIGDGREDVAEDKISEDHIRSIWHDDELYTIHADVDIAAARAELQGTNTSANFSENYIYAEAIITAALYAREKYKGSGNLVFFCTPHLLNVMLLAKDLNGRRIYNSVADVAAALNVSAIYTAEQFEGKTRTTKESKTKKLLGIFVNLADYHVGSTKGGELTKFSQFDIDYNQEKYLIETRLSGALTRVYSAIALEEPVEPSSSSL